MNISKRAVSLALSAIVVLGAGSAAFIGSAQASTPVAPLAVSAPATIGPGLDAPERDEVARQVAAQEAAAQAAADAKAAADALAAQQAATLAAQQAVPKKTAVKATTNTATSYAPGQAPKGTPLPMHQVTDPNNGNFGQSEPEDPGAFCASHSGSTINGIPVCD